MKRFSVFILVLLSLPTFNRAHAQSPELDSLAIDFFKAVRITDSINSPVPVTIREITIKYFVDSKMSPSDYYTTKYYSKYLEEEKGMISFMKLGGLRGLYEEIHSDNGPEILGASGDEGDDIWVIYNKSFTAVIEIINAE